MAEDTRKIVSRFVIRVARHCSPTLHGLNGTCMARSLLKRLPGSGGCVWIMRLTWAYTLERAKGIEPS